MAIDASSWRALQPLELLEKLAALIPRGERRNTRTSRIVPYSEEPCFVGPIEMLGF